MENEQKKEYKKFKEYYADPTFKQRHLAYVSTKVECPECKKMVPRSNMSAHKKTKKHMLKFPKI